MKITSVEALHLRLPNIEQKADGTQEVLIARVTTDSGLVGHGEAVSCSTVARAIIEAPRAAPFRHGLGAALVGRDPLDPAWCGREMAEATRWYGRRGCVVHAIAAIDTALWDIVGQEQGKSCHAVWGNRRAEIRAYASVLFPDTPQEAGALAESLVARGFTAVKFGWGNFGRNATHDRAVLRAIRTAIGDKVELMVDAGRAWTADEALLRAPALFDEFALCWLEEPLNEDDLDGYKRLAAAVSGRIATGETEENFAQFDDLMDRGVAVIQPDVGRAGGLSVCRRLSERAAARRRWCVPHCFGSGVNLVSSIHWAAAAPEAPFIEYPFTASPLRNDLVDGIPAMKDGFVTLPTGTGLGIRLNPEIIDRFRVA
jgi:L-alanine-DL-glutamate epimerase-like enolase superfamily enzyme